jgi:hypothetical protein
MKTKERRGGVERGWGRRIKGGGGGSSVLLTILLNVMWI